MSRPKRIILIRHGESEGNIDRAVYETKPDHKLSLTRQGCTQAMNAGVLLKDIIKNETVHYYVSPYQRARETLNFLLTSGLPEGKIFEDPRLREQDWGHLRSHEATQKLQDERYNYGTFFYRFPNGESGADVFDRVSTFLETLHRDFQKKDYADNAIIVSHGLTVRLFLMRWFHCKVEEFESWANPANCEFFIMQGKGRSRCYLKPEIKIDKEKKPVVFTTSRIDKTMAEITALDIPPGLSAEDIASDGAKG